MREQLSSMNRRRFTKLFGAGAAYLAARPQLSVAQDPTALLLKSSVRPTGVVRLSSNENPYGPSRLAVRAMTDAFDIAWRYPDEHAETLIEMLAKLHDVKTEQILLGDGSGEILKI